jgi:hypothetical protein
MVLRESEIVRGTALGKIDGFARQVRGPVGIPTPGGKPPKSTSTSNGHRALTF